MKRADFEAMEARIRERCPYGYDWFVPTPKDVAREIDRAVRKARKEEREKSRKVCEELAAWRTAYGAKEKP